MDQGVIDLAVASFSYRLHEIHQIRFLSLWCVS